MKYKQPRSKSLRSVTCQGCQLMNIRIVHLDKDRKAISMLFVDFHYVVLLAFHGMTVRADFRDIS